MNWSLMQWTVEGDTVKGMKRLINSLKFWRKRLNSALKKNNKAYPKLQIIADEISSLNQDIVISGYAKFQNRRYLSITFANLEMKKFVIENLKKVEDCEVAYLHWVDDVVLDLISVEWLSDETDLVFSTECIQQYMDIVSAEKETSCLANGSICTSGKVIFKGHLKSNISIDDIPHITKIDDLECLINVQGRPVQCFICSQVGHKASQCRKGFCRSCKLILYRTHVCSSHDNYSHFTRDDRNGLYLQSEEMIYTENFNQTTITEAMQGIEESSRNLFWKENTEVLKESNSMNRNEGLEEKYEDRLGGPSVANELENIVVWKDNVSGGSRISADTKLQRNCSKANPYVRQEESLGSPNFVLVDTSTEESDSEGECTNLYVQMEKSMAELVQSTEVSRSLVQDSLKFMNVEITKQELYAGDAGKLDKTRQLKVETENLIGESADKEGIESPTVLDVGQVMKRGNHNKRKNKKRLGGKR